MSEAASQKRSGEWWSFEQLESDLFEFDAIMTGICGNINTQSGAFPALASEIRRMVAVSRKQATYDNSTDAREHWRGAIGLADLIRKTVNVRNDPKLSSLCPHFRLLERSATITQNRKSPVTDSASNKIFELLVALALLPIATAIELDDPHRSKGKNPDIIATVNGVRLGIACKVPHTPNLKTFADNVRKAIDQIEVANVDVGFVFMNLKNVIDHNELTPAEKDSHGDLIYFGFPSLDAATAALRERVTVFGRGIAAAFGGAQEAVKLFRGKKAAPVIVNYVATMVGLIATPPAGASSALGRMTQAILRDVIGWPVADLTPAQIALLNEINDRLH